MHQNLVKLKLVDDILSETDGLHGSRGGTAVSLDRMGSVTSPFGSDDMGLEALDAIYGPSPRGHQEGVGGRWGESPFRGQHKDADTDKDADMQARAAHVCVGEVARPAAHSVTESLERLPPEKRVVPPHGAPPAPEDTPPSRIANGPSKSTCVHCEPPPLLPIAARCLTLNRVARRDNCHLVTILMGGALMYWACSMVSP